MCRRSLHLRRYRQQTFAFVRLQCFRFSVFYFGVRERIIILCDGSSFMHIAYVIRICMCGCVFVLIKASKSFSHEHFNSISNAIPQHINSGDGAMVAKWKVKMEMEMYCQQSTSNGIILFLESFVVVIIIGYFYGFAYFDCVSARHKLISPYIYDTSLFRSIRFDSNECKVICCVTGIVYAVRTRRCETGWKGMNWFLTAHIWLSSNYRINEHVMRIDCHMPMCRIDLCTGNWRKKNWQNDN